MTVTTETETETESQYAKTVLITEYVRNRGAAPITVPNRVLIDGQDITRLFPPLCVGMSGRMYGEFIDVDLSAGYPVVSLVLMANTVRVDYDAREVWIGEGHPDIERPFQVMAPVDPADLIRVSETNHPESRAYDCVRLRIMFGSVRIEQTVRED